jgi:uncharacterized protein
MTIVPHNAATSLIIVQATPFCNINCSYCYLPDRADRRTLSMEQLKQLFERVFAFPTLADEVTVVWHAGEPLVLGIDYYREAFELVRAMRPPNLQVRHAFQTNGMLLNEQWCDFLIEQNVGIGVSIDGPAHIHDLSRRTRAGAGTFAKTLTGIKLLQRRDIPFQIISVLGGAALEDPDSLFEFYRINDLQEIGFNIEEIEGCNTHTSIDPVAAERKIERFFARLSQLMEQHRFPLKIRELEETMLSIRHLNGDGPVNNLVIPFGIVTIDVKGGVYTFSPELAGYSNADFPSLSIGNIFEHSFDELAASPVLEKQISQIGDGIARCRSNCDYFPVCGGGAPSNKFFENGTFASAETMHCRMTKKGVANFLMTTIDQRMTGLI